MNQVNFDRQCYRIYCHNTIDEKLLQKVVNGWHFGELHTDWQIDKIYMIPLVGSYNNFVDDEVFILVLVDENGCEKQVCAPPDLAEELNKKNSFPRYIRAVRLGPEPQFDLV